MPLRIFRFLATFKPVAIAAIVALLFAVAPNAIADETRAGRSTGVEGGQIGGNQFAQLAEEVTRTMLASDSFARITAGGQKPKLVVGSVVNRTDDETISVGDIGRRISEVVVEADVVRWFEFGYTDFDLIVQPMLSGTYITNGRRREYTWTLTLTLSDIEGEVKGRWSATRSYTG